MFKHATIVSAIVFTFGLGVSARQSQVPTPQPGNPQTPPSTPRNPPSNPQAPGSSPMNPGPPGTAQPHVMPGMSSGVPMPGSTTTASPAAAAFLKKVAQDNLAETDLAQLVQTKAASADVKSYAQMLATDHQKANDEVRAIAKSKNVTLPTTPPLAAKATKARLEKLSGAAFDRAYAAAMVADHQKAIAAFTAATKNADPEVKAFAEKTLPTLTHHLEQAQKLSRQQP